MGNSYMRPVWVEINLDHLAFNLAQIRKVIGPTVKLMAVVKGDGYGTGICGIVDTMLASGIDMLGVGILDEALLLRKLGVKIPVLVFGYTPFQYAEILVKNKIRQTVYCYEQAVALSMAAEKLSCKAVIHLEIDTGMGRLGFRPQESALQEIKKISALPGLDVEGIYTHCPYTNERDGAGKQFTQRQYQLFCNFINQLAAAGIDIPLKHACNSLGIVHYPSMHLDMVRAGIILYGSYPRFQETLPVKPVLTLKTRIGSIKKLPAGENVSYGHTFTTKRPTWVATLPVGYGDGYSRMLTNKGYVLIHGQRVPLIGTICMDQCMADITDLARPCQIGEEVVLIGQQGKEEITVEELSQKACDFINYEYLVQIGHRVPRLYLQGGKIASSKNYFLESIP